MEKTIKLDVDKNAVESNTGKKYARGRVHVNSRSVMPEKQLFSFAEYKAKDAERIGYSEYSYWKSVWRNFLKNKLAVTLLILFGCVFLFTFIAPMISKFDVHDLRIDNALMFTKPNGEYWFGTDNLGRDYWSQVWYATRSSIILAVSVSFGQIFHRRGDRPAMGLRAQARPPVHGNLQLHRQRAHDHLHDPDRHDDRQDLHGHGLRNDRLRLACDRAKHPQPGLHVPRPRVQPGLPLPGRRSAGAYWAATSSRTWSASSFFAWR